MSLGPIPVSKIRAWCIDNELDPEAADLIKHVVRRLDIDRAAAEAARHATQQATGPRARGRTP